MAALDGDTAVRAVVLTGAGTRAFTARLDLKELGSDASAMADATAANAAVSPDAIATSRIAVQMRGRNQ